MTKQTIKVWDIWVRLFHWSFAIAVLVLLFTGETGNGFYDWHRLAGEVVLALLVFRLCWSFVGSSNASLVSLIVNPLDALKHLRLFTARKTHSERGHNAAGGWAVLLMLLLVGVQALTGLFIADEDELVEGAFYGVFDSGFSHTLHEIHHINARLIQIVVGLHVVMVLGYLFYARQNLIWPMIIGRMGWGDSTSAPDVKFGAVWLGLVLALVVGFGFGFLLGWFGGW